MSHDELIESLKALLNAVAIKIHQSGEGSIDLRRFREDKAGLAEVLWNVAQSDNTMEEGYDLPSDAAARVGMRSLLKRPLGGDDDAEQWTVEFSHRSLKEYFVARAILSSLESASYDSHARHLLRELNLEPVILHFLRQFQPQHQSVVLTRLRSLTRSAIVGNNDGRLGGNALSCFVTLGGTAHGLDWSELELDTALLGGADLSGSTFKKSRLRWAVLDNSDLSDADLRDADLTGVRLEETAGVVALTSGVSGAEVIVLYDDRSVRRWRISEAQQSVYESVISSLPAGYTGLSFLTSGFALLFGAVGASIWAADDTKPWEEIARFPMDNRIRRIEALDTTLAVVSEDDAGSLYLSALNLMTTDTLWTRRCSSDAISISSSFICGVDTKGDISVFGRWTGEVATQCSVEGVVSSLSLREEGADIQLAVVTAAGDIFIVEPFGDDDKPAIVATGRELHDTMTTSTVWIDVGLASGGGARKIVVARQAESEVVVDMLLQRELRCAGAKVHGLIGASERLRLVAYGAVE